MGFHLDKRDLYKTAFWDLDDLDPGDLAVSVAGDLCERRINPWDYLVYYGYWDRLNLVRVCLLLGYPPEYLEDRELDELVEFIDNSLTVYFPEYKRGDARNREYMLKVHFLYPFAIFNQDTCLHIDYNTLPHYSKDINELKEDLMNHIGFYKYNKWFLNKLRRIEY